MAEVTNYIDRLVAELCPDGVEYRPLESLGKRNKGTAITASKMRSLEPGKKDLILPYFQMIQSEECHPSLGKADSLLLLPARSQAK